MKNHISKGIMFILLALCTGIFIASIFMEDTNADYKIDEKFISYINSDIKNKCLNNSGSGELYFEDDMGTRCTLILQAITRFETDHLREYKYNNIFNFRSNNIKKEWKEIGAIGVTNGFIEFDRIESSITFAVNRFYKFDRYKTITQIISGGCYISPVDGLKKCFGGFTLTSEHWDNYIGYVKKYYKENIDLLDNI